MVLAKKEAFDRFDQLFAIEMLKKAHIINRRNVPVTITEKQSLPCGLESHCFELFSLQAS